AAILWGEAAKAPEAAELMRVTAPDLLKLGVIDAIVPEPVGGAHRNWDATAASLREALREQLWQLRSKSEAELIEERQEKFRRDGVLEENACAVRSARSLTCRGADATVSPDQLCRKILRRRLGSSTS